MYIYSRLFHLNSNKLIITKELFLSKLSCVSRSCCNKYHTHNLRLGKFTRIMKMDAPLLSTTSKSELPVDNQGMKTKTKLFVGIALISTVVAGDSNPDPNQPFVLTPDAEKWMKEGIANANRDLDQFDAIAENLKAGSPDHTPLETQLKLLQNVIVDVANNNRELIPKLVDLIKKINGFLESDSPSIFSKAALKALIWYVDGKRDNKSYYLLDGAQLWCELRVNILKDEKYVGSSDVDLLKTDLKSMQKATADLRDELDGFAQIFVRGIKKIHSMTCDIGANLVELKKTAKDLLEVSEQSGPFLDHTKDLEKKTADLIAKY